MMIEADLFYMKGKINARGYHDPQGKCFVLKAGSSGTICSNPKNMFFPYPNILKMYETEVLKNRDSAGDDTHYYLSRDLRCYPIDNYDELSVAATLISGSIVKGEYVWKNEKGVSIRQMRASKPIDENSEETKVTEEIIKRYDAATEKTFEIMSSHRSQLINTLSLAYHLKTALGTKNEDRFVVPRQVDHCIATFGFLCEEEDAYDLRIPDLDYTISDKMANDLFHQNVSKKVRPSTIKEGLQMSNTRSGQSSDNHQRPVFDCLLVMQYIPYLVCGVTPYHKIITHFRHTDGGWILAKVPVSHFKYVISPTENILPCDIPSNVQTDINEFAYLVKGGFLPKLLDKMPRIEDTPIPKTELW